MQDIATIIILILITFVPAIELRGSILYGLTSTNLSTFTIFTTCVLANMVLGPVAYFVVEKFINFFLQFKTFDRWYQKHIEKTQKRIHKYTAKYGLLGLSLFIAIPAPGSGSYTGALGAKLLGIKFRKYLLANILGVLIAGVIVTLVVSSGGELFRILF